ncbi:MAG: hypothetical protein QNK37_17420, partial [Acidobacteriota bacterium]|nr:hypothetical protein [Acidobacteriota bacterium]
PGNIKAEKLVANQVFTQKVQEVDADGQILRAIRSYRVSNTELGEMGALDDAYQGCIVSFRREGSLWDIKGYRVVNKVRERVDLDEIAVDELGAAVPGTETGNYDLFRLILPREPVAVGASWDLDPLAAFDYMEVSKPYEYSVKKEYSKVKATLVSVKPDAVQLRLSGELLISARDRKNIMTMTSKLQLKSLLVSLRPGPFMELSRLLKAEMTSHGESTDGKMRARGANEFHFQRLLSPKK